MDAGADTPCLCYDSHRRWDDSTPAPFSRHWAMTSRAATSWFPRISHFAEFLFIVRLRCRRCRQHFLCYYFASGAMAFAREAFARSAASCSLLDHARLILPYEFYRGHAAVRFSSLSHSHDFARFDMPDYFFKHRTFLPPTIFDKLARRFASKGIIENNDCSKWTPFQAIKFLRESHRERGLVTSRSMRFSDWQHFREPLDDYTSSMGLAARTL